MHNLLMQVFTLHTSKTLLLGDGGRGSPKTLVCNLLMLLFTLHKNRQFYPFFLDIVIT